jgi:aspartate-semialdehyde dehydrogenase
MDKDVPLLVPEINLTHRTSKDSAEEAGLKDSSHRPNEHIG